jgi:BirA family transcriptional regulator, biotin operon repressor / biotin---[acetyl-CoA-carboxylase] ligase
MSCYQLSRAAVNLGEFALIDIQTLLTKTFVRHAEHHAVIDSTQTRARALADNTAAILPALIVADTQTAGRGRGSNRWWTGEGSLAFSLLLDAAEFGFPRQPIPRLSLAAGVAIIDTVAPRLDGYALGLHWPNDVYVGAGKLAGILVEVLPNGRHIVGVGLNSNNTLAEAPSELSAALATLRDLTERQHDHTELLVDLMENLHAAIVQLGQPMETLGERFDLLCRQHGEVLTVHQGEQKTTGVCAGIAVDGALRLDTPEGRRAMYSGTLKPQPTW